MYKVKVISLKRRQDRRKKISHMLQQIDFDFVDGLDGQKYKLTKFDKEFIKGNDYKKHGIHIPSLVCANYTHLNLLDECSKQDQPYFIFEDDVKMTGAKIIAHCGAAFHTDKKVDHGDKIKIGNLEHSKKKVWL